MPDELVEHRLSKLESALFSIDQSLQKLVAIEQSQTQMREEMRDAIKLQNTLAATVAAHSERLDSHRWALRLIIGGVVTGFLTAVYAVIT